MSVLMFPCIMPNLREGRVQTIEECKDGYDFELTPHVQEEMYDVKESETTSDFYERIIEFYKNDKQVRCYEEHGECNSESDNE